ncbi:MAG: peptidylprolyl isomerase [Lachnospiraceae bacterium]|nr:peptidylprolyl isomerase [Lachnospiraceae bacterium]
MKKSKWIKGLTIGLVVACVLCGCGQGDNVTTSQTTATSGNKGAAQSGGTDNVQNSSTSQDGETDTVLLSGKHRVNIIIKDKGTIKVELDADAAPITVTNFVNLAKDGFYDGVVFHRIIEDFMMQGGDPTGTGNGGSGTTIKGEFAINGVKNNLSHTRGAISMARSSKNDSASSQFFIVHEDSFHLDGQYACFGYVTEGMEIVDDICENTEGGDANGIIPEANRPVIETIEVVD